MGVVKKSVVKFLSLLLITASYTGNLLSHGVANDRIANINKRIEQTPNDPALFVKRGRVQADVQHWHAALNDYQKALVLDPNFSEAHYWIGLLYSQTKQWQKALNALKKYLSVKPNAALGYEATAEVLVHTKQWREAATYFDRAISKSSTVKPQTYIDRAQALMNLKPLPLSEIEQGLMQGIETHGKLVSYIEAAVQACLGAKNYSSALLWIRQLPQNIQNTPEWMLRTAQIYEKENNRNTAIQAYQKLLNKLSQLPKHRRNIPAWKSIRNESEAALNRLTSQ